MKQRKPILSRLQKRLNALRGEPAAGGRGAGTPMASDSFAFSAEIPGGKSGKPLWRLSVEMHTQSQGDGEHVQMRLHWQANLASNQALSAPGKKIAIALQAEAASGGHPIAERVGHWLRTGLSQPLVRQLAQPLLRHDFNSWVEVRASSADLADSRTLVPQRERLQALGVEIADDDKAQAKTWAGAASGAGRGFAQLSLLRLDKRHLPPALAVLLGSRPFQLAAAIVNVVEEKPPR